MLRIKKSTITPIIHVKLMAINAAGLNPRMGSK
jgi:hypothetical protein